MKNHFKSAGKVVSAQILRRARKGKLISTGSGLVQFSTTSEAAKAVNALSGSLIDEREITCKLDKKNSVLDALEQPLATATTAEKTRERVPVANSVYVGNLAWSVTDEDLAAHFSQAGAVKTASVRKSKSGRSLGNATVEFHDASSVVNAIQTLNDSELAERKVSVREFFEK